MKATESFNEIIRDHLEQAAAADPMFAASYGKKVLGTKIKQTISPERIKGILTDVQFMAVVAQLVENWFQYHLVDANLRNPVYRNSARQIITAAERIKKEIAFNFNLINKEALVYDVSIQLDRALSFFMMLPAETIDEIMSGLEEQLEEARKEVGQ